MNNKVNNNTKQKKSVNKSTLKTKPQPKYDWNKIKDKWNKSNCVSIREFCDIENIYYITARKYLSRTDKEQLQNKLAAKKFKAYVQKRKEIAIQEGYKLAEEVTAQRDIQTDMGDLLAAEWYAIYKLSENEQNVDKRKQLLADMTTIRQKMANTTKTVFDFDGEKIDIQAKMLAYTIVKVQEADDLDGQWGVE